MRRFEFSLTRLLTGRSNPSRTPTSEETTLLPPRLAFVFASRRTEQEAQSVGRSDTASCSPGTKLGPTLELPSCGRSGGHLAGRCKLRWRSRTIRIIAVRLTRSSRRSRRLESASCGLTRTGRDADLTMGPLRHLARSVRPDRLRPSGAIRRLPERPGRAPFASNCVSGFHEAGDLREGAWMPMGRRPFEDT